MKISPVAGTPTIPQPSSTGLSPEKLQRLKSIASGKEPVEPHEEKVKLEEKAPPSTKSIKMNTIKTPEQPVAAQEAATAPVQEPVVTQDSTISDAGVQTKPAPEAIQHVSPQVAALAKQKRALQAKERELAEKEKALLAPGHSVAELKQKVQSGRALSVLEDLGITYDQLTNELLGKQAAPNLTEFEEKILKSVDERLAKKDSSQEDAVFDHMKGNVDRLTSTEAYPFIKAWKSQDKVMELIKRSWHENGEVLDEEEALNLIEAELKEESKVFQTLLKEPEPTTPAAAEPQQKPVVETAGIKTLTNKDSARPGSSRRQRALAAFLGQK